jgi:hypothetical protein
VPALPASPQQVVGYQVQRLSHGKGDGKKIKIIRPGFPGRFIELLPYAQIDVSPIIRR